MALTLSLGMLVLLAVVAIAASLRDHPPTSATPEAPPAVDMPGSPLQVFRVPVATWTSLDPAVRASLCTWGPWLLWDGHAESPPVRVGLDAWDSLQTALQAAQVPYLAIHVPDALTPRESGLHEASPSTSTLRRTA